MKVAAVICELNPMHAGHEYIFEQARKVAENHCEDGESVCVAAIMSGNFTQRSEAAVYDKYTRAEAAVKCGAADIVIELPMPWCCCSAEFFARAGVYIASEIGADFLVFGSECGEKELLEKAAAALESEEYKNIFDQSSKQFKSCGAAVLKNDALSKILGEDASKLTSPNDILGIEYIRSAKIIPGAPECIPVKRTSGNNIKSASDIRNYIFEVDSTAKTNFINKFLHPSTLKVFAQAKERGIGPVDQEILQKIEFLHFRLKSSDAFSTLAECGGGLGMRLSNIASLCSSSGDFMQKAKTKKYTDSRIRRASLFALANIPQTIVHELPKFTYLLASGKAGLSLLSKISLDAELIILTKPSSAKKFLSLDDTQIKLNAFADNIYTLCMPKIHPTDYFIKCSPYILK